MKRATIIALCLFLFLSPAGFAEEVIKLATTTSTYETGLLDYILQPFEKKHDVKVHVISVGTGKAIKLGEAGDVDVILVHAREAEEKFVNEGHGVKRYRIMYNDFIILAPKDDPADVSGLKDVRNILEGIANAEHTFVSRGDDSGTDKKEKSLWRKAKIVPKPAWYLETGQGMNASLRIADEKNAYIMLDRATYLFNKDRIRLMKIKEGDKDLFNPYGVIAVNPYKHPHVKYDLSAALIRWLMSGNCREMINGYTIKGNQLFFAD